MMPFSKNGRSIWVGTLPKLGLVIYDKRAQGNVPSASVRLFVCSRRKSATFSKVMVRKCLRATVRPEQVIDADAARAAERYFAARQRSTHCFACKRDLNSIEFEICNKCGWIKCECMACGCEFRKRESH